MTTKSPKPIERELKQNVPFRSPHAETVVTLLRTADVVRRSVSRAIEPHGITLQQYNVLRILRGAGSAGLPTLEIAERMIENTPGITRLLDRLEAKHLVRRERSSEDRRCVYCWITDEGRRLLAGLDPEVEEAGRRTMSKLRNIDMKDLNRLLDLVRGGPA